jgi:hypothetical protein
MAETDIVEMREWAQERASRCRQDYPGVTERYERLVVILDQAHEAAAEIERLRAELEGLREASGKVRRSLEQIIARKERWSYIPIDTEACSYAVQDCSEMHDAAEYALAALTKG